LDAKVHDASFSKGFVERHLDRAETSTGKKIQVEEQVESFLSVYAELVRIGDACSIRNDRCLN
jgi:hypothetical protein